MAKMKFSQAIFDAYDTVMAQHPEVYLLGVGLSDPKAVFDTIKGLYAKYGSDRVVDGPLAEQMLTGLAFASATLGLRPVLIHHRVDFLPLTLDQILNHAAKWSYMFGGQQCVPMVIRGVVGRGWGNGPQHTQSLHGLFAHIPGIKVVVPSSPQSAKGLTTAAILDNDPVIFIDHRWLHQDEGDVPEGIYIEEIGKAQILEPGTDATIVAIGPMVQEVLKVSQSYAKQGVSLEVIDLKTLRPIDFPTIFASVRKTGRIVVVDSDWPYGSVNSTIIAEVSKACFESLRAPPRAVTWPDHPVPSSYGIEPEFYPMAKEIALEVSNLLQGSAVEILLTDKQMLGPF